MSIRIHFAAELALSIGLSLNAHAAGAANLPANCLAPEAIQPANLYGRWHLTLGAPEKPVGAGLVVFTPHPEYAGSVRGSVERQTDTGLYKALVAGDVTHKGFQLEESVDGVNIDAVWTGDVTAVSCGREIQGWRRVLQGNTAREPESDLAFTLKKAASPR